jgi:GNAT superfamily N-acetyltransferase
MGAPSDPPLRIIPFEPRLAADFKRLNVEWLERYFGVEPFDERVFSDPIRHVLEPGGFIVFAQLGDDIVGTCALLKAGEGRYELAKMAVTERYQGLGIGRRLLDAAIQKFRTLDGSELFLESNTSLSAAMTLYETSGFVRVAHPDGHSHYARSDVYMVYKPAAPEAEEKP